MDPRSVPLPEPVLPEQADLLDLFAAHALGGLANVYGPAQAQWTTSEREGHYDKAARAAYGYAAAMMRERARRKG